MWFNYDFFSVSTSTTKKVSNLSDHYKCTQSKVENGVQIIDTLIGV